MTYYDIKGNEINENYLYYLIGEEANIYNYNEVIERFKNDETLDFIRTNSCDYFICRDCNKVLSKDDIEYWAFNNGDFICNDCYESGDYCWCDDCERLFYCDDLRYNEDDDAYYCDDCYESHSQIIYSYHHHKGDEDFKSTNYDNTDLYFGVELEVENGDYKNNNTIAHYIYNNLNDDVYYENDGSLRNGFEIISQPFTFNYWRDVLSNKYKNMCDYLIDNGYKSNDTTTCGLHVHVSKNALGDTYNEINDNVNKIILFTEFYKDNIIKLARRGSTHYMQFLSDYISNNNNNNNYDNLLSQSIKSIDAEKNNTRYFAINNTNDNTLEFRIFKGTLKHSTIYATLEFINNLVQCVKMYPLNKISFSKVINANKTAYLKDYIKERGIVYDSKYMCDATNKMKKIHNKRLKALKLTNTNLELLINEYNIFYNKKISEILKDKDVTLPYKNKTIKNIAYRTEVILEYLNEYKSKYNVFLNIDYINKENINTILSKIDNIIYNLKQIDYQSNKLDLINKNIILLKEVL